MGHRPVQERHEARAMTPGYNFRDTAPLIEPLPTREEVIDSDEPIGTEHSGYAPPKEGPFECGNCAHYASVNGTHGGCDHPKVVEDAETGEIKLLDGKALVAMAACCNFYRKREGENAGKE